MNQSGKDTQSGSMRRHLIGLAVSIALSAGILAILWLYNGVRFDRLLIEWNRAEKGILAAVIVLSAAFHVFVGAHKLWFVLRSMGLLITYRETLLVRLGAGPLRVFVPLKAGEFLNILYFWYHKRMPFGRASGASVFDRGLNLIGAAFWLMIGLVLLPETWPSAWRMPLIAGVIAAYLVLFFCTPLHGLLVRLARPVHPKVGRLVEGMLAPFREFSGPRKLVFTAYALVFQLRPLIVCYFLFRAYGVSLDPVRVLAYGSLAIFAAHVPGFIVGMGPREAVIVTMFASNAPAETLLSIGLLLTFSVHVIPMLLGLPWMTWFLRHLRRHGS